MTLYDLMQTVANSSREDWNTIVCWGANSAPSYRYRLDFCESPRESRGVLLTGDHAVVASYIPDISISLAFGMSCVEDFQEDFHQTFPDSRASSAYIDVYYKEVDRVADSSIVDPTIGMETSRRIALAWEVRVVEGGSPPGKYVDANNIQHWTLKLATLNRLNGNAQITNAMIVDERNVNRMIALISELDAHANAFSVHGATNAATANRIILRDSVGRAQVAAPAAAADIARKDTVDAVQTNLNNHANLTAAHSATATPTANRIATFDASGRLKSAAAPNAADDVMRLADYTLAGLGITKTAAEINAVANGLAGDPIEIINPNSYNNITSSQTLASVALNNIGVGSIGLCIGFCSVGGFGGTGYYSCGARIASLSGDYIVRFLGGTPEGGVMLPNVSHAYNGSSFGADLSVCVPFIVHTLGSHTITFRFQPMSRPTSASFHIGANSKFALIWLNKQ